MEKIGKYISELLYDYDCVIIPGFGGLVARKLPAGINPVSHTFSPPSKQIMFNSSLTRDDGLLVDYLSAKEEIAFEEARSWVEAFTHTIQEKLREETRVELSGIGEWRITKGGQLLFEPDPTVNYLSDAYGLSLFISPPPGEKVAGAVPVFADRKPAHATREKKRPAWQPLLWTLPALLLLGLWFFVPNPRFIDSYQYTSIIPVMTEENSNTPEKAPATGQPVITGDERNSEAIPSESNGFESKKGLKTEALPESAASTHTGPLFHIIGGAFSEPENAQKFVSELRSKGYPAAEAGISPSGYLMVEYLSTPERSEALIRLREIRVEENPSAWLLKK